MVRGRTQKGYISLYIHQHMQTTRSSQERDIREKTENSLAVLGARSPPLPSQSPSPRPNTEFQIAARGYCDANCFIVMLQCITYLSPADFQSRLFIHKYPLLPVLQLWLFIHKYPINYKTFCFFLIYSFCYVLGYTLCLNTQ